MYESDDGIPGWLSLIIAIGSFGLSFADGWIFSLAWSWLVIPALPTIPLPTIGWLPMTGLSVFVKYVTYSFPKKSLTVGESIYQFIGYILLVPIMLGILALYKTIIYGW